MVYQRMRAPLKTLLGSSLLSNVFLTFIVFFLFTFNLFIFSFYIQPSLNMVEYHPEVYHLSGKSLILDSYTRNTFTQFLKYGNFAYGLVFSFWVGLNAVLYSSLGFFTVLLFKNKLIGIAFPVLFYLIGTFSFSFSDTLAPFRMADVVFPFSIEQEPIITTCVTVFVLFLINIFLSIYVFKFKINSLEDTI